MNYVGNPPAPGGIILVGDTNPVGMIGWFHSQPTNWLTLDGRVVSKTAYADLWTYAQGFLTADQVANPGLYRSVDAATFALPNLSGLFVRGTGANDGTHVASALGVKQADANLSHNHIPADGTSFQTVAGGPAYGSAVTGANATGSTSFSGGPEARPVNVALMPCVKALPTTLMPSSSAALDSLAARVTALEANAPVVSIRRLYVGTVTGAVLTQSRSLGGIAVARTGNGTFAVTFTPAEANANYGVLFGGGVNSDTTGAWIVESPPLPQTVNGFTFQSSTWSTGRVLMDPNYIAIAII